MIKKDTAGIWGEYETGVEYKNRLGVYDAVQRNNDFFIGDQWKGVDAPDMDKPVVNILKRPTSYLVASIMSEDIAISLARHSSDEADRPLMDMLEGQYKSIMETAQVKKRLRKMVKNACIDGDGCVHYYFAAPESIEPDANGRYQTQGHIESETLENVNVFFGNRETPEVQAQPWIILRFRRELDELRTWAQEHGIDPAGIVGDGDERGTNHDTEENKVTVLRKYWREGGSIRFCETTHTVMLRPEEDTGLQRYPLIWMPWEEIKNRYHGQAALTGMIPNQIYRNKLLAMAMRHVYMMAFPKVVYNRTLVQNWTNRVGEAIAARGDPNQAVAAGFRAPDMSNQVLELIRLLKDETVEVVGASDAALGNVKPENTSAIIAAEQATAVPLELQKRAFYDAVEESARIWLDMMAAFYGVRSVYMDCETVPGVYASVPEYFDFGKLRGEDIRLNVEVGAASYWSELSQTSTLSNLFSAQVIDVETFLRYLPKGALPQKQSIIDDMKKAGEVRAAKQLQMQSAPTMGGATLAQMPAV